VARRSRAAPRRRHRGLGSSTRRGSLRHRPLPDVGLRRTGLPAIRAFYHLERKDAQAAAALAKRIIIGYFQNGLDTDDPNAIAAAAAPLGINRDMILAGIADPEVEVLARQQGEQAVARGGLGAPRIFLEGRRIWGGDLLPVV